MSDSQDADSGDTQIIVVYTTTRGTTQTMAEAVTNGARSVDDAEVSLIQLETGEEVALDTLRDCDGLIMGSPMRHRNMDARLKTFVEVGLEQLWLTDEMVGTVGGVFTIGGGYGNMGAGCEMAQLGMLCTMAANGMILVTHPKTTPGFDDAGMHWGPAGRTGGQKMQPKELTEEMLNAGRHHGANVTRVAGALKGRELLARGNVAPPPEVLEQFTEDDSTSMPGD